MADTMRAAGPAKRERARQPLGPFRAGYVVNKLLGEVATWRGVLSVARDLEPLFDHINVATAMHRLAKAAHAHKVCCLRGFRVLSRGSEAYVSGTLGYDLRGIQQQRVRHAVTAAPLEGRGAMGYHGAAPG